MSMEEYERFEALDDAYWIARAEANSAEGYLDAEESRAFIQGILNATD